MLMIVCVSVCVCVCVCVCMIVCVYAHSALVFRDLILKIKLYIIILCKASVCGVCDPLLTVTTPY